MNIPNKMQQPSISVPYLDLTKKNSDAFYPQTPLISQQTPQIMPPTNYTYQSPMDVNSPNITNRSTNIDLIHQPSNLQMYNPNMASSSPNYGAQTPAMNFSGNDRSGNNFRANSPGSPVPLNGLAGSSPAQPNNITMYRPQTSNMSLIHKNSSIQNGPNNINISKDIEPKLQNIVSTANLGCQLKLRQIALQAKNAEYNPKRFAAVIMRIKEPKTTALIFSSGKMVCTGAKSEEDSRKASRKYAKIIKSLGLSIYYKCIYFIFWSRIYIQFLNI